MILKETGKKQEETGRSRMKQEETEKNRKKQEETGLFSKNQ